MDSDQDNVKENSSQSLDSRQRFGGLTTRLAGYKKHHKKAMAGLSVFVVVLLFFFLLQPFSGFIFTNKKDNLLQANSALAKSINAIPSPESITFAQPNSDTRSVTNQSTEQYQVAKEAADNLSVPGYYSLLAWTKFNVSPRAVNALRQDTAAATSQVNNDLSDYVASLEAMLPFFEYSPTTDFLEFDLGSTDTQERLERLKDGLQTVTENLQDIDSPLAQSLIPVVEEGKEITNTLKQDGNVDEFSESFSILQEQARENLIKHRFDLFSDIRSNLVDLNRTTQKTL